MMALLDSYVDAMPEMMAAVGMTPAQPTFSVS